MVSRLDRLWGNTEGKSGRASRVWTSRRRGGLNAPMERRLPEGLSPVTAGRFGLWLLGRRAYRAARRRRALPYRRHHGVLARRVAALLAPWDVYEYPGAARFLSGLLGISHATAARYLRPGIEFPRKHAPRLAEYLEAHAAECVALALELRDYARAVRGVKRRAEPGAGKSLSGNGSQ